jgi:ABC-2 type transport system permease protein
MTTQIGRPPIAAARSSVSLFSRVYGFGSVYAKTLRDSRLSFLIMAGLTGGLLLTVGAAIGKDIASPSGRLDLTRLVQSMPPIVAGLAGNPVNVGTLGGYLSWKYGPFFEIMVGIWSILALSGTLATEAQRGSLDFVAAAPFGKRRLALEKLTAHVTVMGLVAAILAVCAWAAGALFGTVPEDAIPVGAAIDYALLVGLIGLACGGVAFALGPIVGRGSAAGIAGVVLMAGYLVNGYQASVPAFQPLAGLTWFGWTAGNLPLAGQLDWPSLLPVAVAVLVLFAIGVEGFARRDVGVTSAIPWPGLPAATLGVGGPARRSFGERLPLALGWGIAIGFLGFIMGAAARSVADALAAASPDTLGFFRAAFPDYDLRSAGSLLELVFVGIGLIFAGFAAATLVAGWGSDESSGRLEMVLATPLSRARWAVAGGLGVYGAITAMTVVFAVGIGIGAAITGGDVLTPVVGTVVLGLYAAAMAGVGLAVGGLVRTSIAGEAVAAVVIATFLVDLVAPALKLPDWVHQLALSAHMGQPMIGTWDWAGIVACLVLAIGGLALSGWGMARRDVSG